MNNKEEISKKVYDILTFLDEKMSDYPSTCVAAIGDLSTACCKAWGYINDGDEKWWLSVIETLQSSQLKYLKKAGHHVNSHLLQNPQGANIN